MGRPHLLTIPVAHNAASPISPGFDALMAKLGVHGADSLLTPTVLSAVARKGSLDQTTGDDCLLSASTVRIPSTPLASSLVHQYSSPLSSDGQDDVETTTVEHASVTAAKASAGPQRSWSTDSLSSVSSTGTNGAVAASGSTSSLTPSQSSATTPGTGSKKNRGRRMSSHVTLANTSVGLREIAKQIGKAVLKWEAPPKTILIVTKVHDPELVSVTRKFADWLLSLGMTVWVEDRLKDDPLFGWADFGADHLETSPDLDDQSRTATAMHFPTSLSTSITEDTELSPCASIASTASSFATTSSSTTPPSRLRFWNAQTCESQCSASIDLIITLGGDGTVLFTASLFQTCRVPPIIPFDLGSLGFLAVFPYTHHRQVLTNVITGPDGFAVNMRMRLACTVHRRHIPTNTYRIEKTFHVLNELVVDRGPSPYMSELELYVDDAPLTTMQADGLVIATPTGSTAYSLSANGSMVHPAVPTILVTPICPHTLSFRPMLLPDSIELKVMLPLHARTATACASFDGRGRVELGQGDFVTVTMSRFPVPTVSKEDQSRDWIESLGRCLHWNVRARQKAFA
ncbi:ATP-NAD kinase-like domain-containing protein [Chytridium lagenaria]|nr:ATP-NAD kinase-like domain-containing protein [Chytridium lagenaria]